jgi:hypothetical protein
LLRIESFHKDLYAAMELRERAETVSRMFTRLDATIRSELTAIEIREQHADEQRRIRRNAAISALSFIAVPLGFLLAFFGINAQQVDGHLSIFDWGHYLTVYIAAAVLAFTPVFAFLVLNGRAWLKNRSEQRERDRAVARERNGSTAPRGNALAGRQRPASSHRDRQAKRPEHASRVGTRS